MRGLTGTSGQLGGSVAQLENSLNQIGRTTKFTFIHNLKDDFKAIMASTKGAAKDIDMFKKKLAIADTFKDWIDKSIISGKFKIDDMLPESITKHFGNKLGKTFGEAAVNLDNFNSSLDETIQDYEKLAKAGKKLRGDLVDLFKKFAPILAILGTIVATIKMIKKSISVAAIGDQILDESRKLHLNTVAYQEWGYVLQQNGIQMSSLKQAMRQFSNNIATDAGKLNKYGIAGENINDKFSSAVTAIQNMKTETEKVAAMIDLFGTRAAELMPIFNMTNEATENLRRTYTALGATMSDDLIRKSDELTDSITEMKAAFTGLGNSLGSVFMPMLIKVVQTISLAVGKITILLKAIFGVKETFKGADKASTGFAEDMSSAVGSAKKLKNLIAGFDELNVLPSQDGDDAGGLDLGDYDTVASDFKFTDGLADKLEKFKTKVEENIEWIRGIAVGLAAFLTSKILGGILKKLFGIALPLKSILGLALSIAGAFYLVKNAVDAWKNGLNLDNLKGMLLSIIPLVAGLAIAFGPVGAAIGLLIGGITLLVVGFHEFVKTGKMSKETAIAIVAGFALIGGAIALLTGSWIPLLLAVVGVIVATVLKHKDKIVEGIKKAWESIKTAFSDAWKWIVSKWNSFTEWIKTSVGKIGTFFSESWSKFTEGIKEVFENIKVWFQDNILVLFTADYWKTKWENLTNWVSEGIKSVLNAIVEKIEGTINGIADKINNSGIVQGINKLTGASIQFPTISLPRMAGGGVFTAPSIVEVGEYSNAASNPEIITPQSVMMQTMQLANQDLINAIYTIGNQISKSVDDKDTNLYMDTAKVTRRITREQSAQNKRQGSSLVLV